MSFVSGKTIRKRIDTNGLVHYHFRTPIIGIKNLMYPTKYGYSYQRESKSIVEGNTVRRGTMEYSVSQDIVGPLATIASEAVGSTQCWTYGSYFGYLGGSMAYMSLPHRGFNLKCNSMYNVRKGVQSNKHERQGFPSWTTFRSLPLSIPHCAIRLSLPQVLPSDST